MSYNTILILSIIAPFPPLSGPLWVGMTVSVSIFGVGSSITLMFQAFVCARIGMDYCKSDRDKMIAGVMAAVLATQGTAWAFAWALAVGFGLNIFLSNWNPFERKEVQKEKSEL